MRKDIERILREKDLLMAILEELEIYEERR